MKPRKNKKRIDPRYFLNETIEEDAWDYERYPEGPPPAALERPVGSGWEKPAEDPWWTGGYTPDYDPAQHYEAPWSPREDTERAEHEVQAVDLPRDVEQQMSLLQAKLPKEYADKLFNLMQLAKDLAKRSKTMAKMLEPPEQRLLRHVIKAISKL